MPFFRPWTRGVRLLPPPPLLPNRTLTAVYVTGWGHLVHGDPFGGRTPSSGRGRRSKGRGVGTVPIPGRPPAAALSIDMPERRDLEYVGCP